MFALCIESSHARGMGHYFRALNLGTTLRCAGEQCRILINDHEPALKHLLETGLDYDVVNLADLESDWEGKLIAQYGIHVWINDRLNTDERHAFHVKRRKIPLVTFDDRGTGAGQADLNIAALSFDPNELLLGHRVLRGVDYLVLNPEISKYRRIRRYKKKMLVTLGGSDTYGVTLKVVRALRVTGRTATVVIGPGFRHDDQLKKAIGTGFEVKCRLRSLIAEFAHYDLAVTGGGITPFEANASGLPCIVIANELFEVPAAKALETFGSSVFAGHYAAMDESIFTRELPIETMSRSGMAAIGLGGAARIVEELTSL